MHHEREPHHRHGPHDGQEHLPASPTRALAGSRHRGQHSGAGFNRKGPRPSRPVETEAAHANVLIRRGPTRTVLRAKGAPAV